MKFLIIVSFIALSRAQQLVSEVQPEPISPYSFGYSAEATDGSSSRQESADASGTVRGSYTLEGADGVKRVVNYIADQHGFRAQVQTNEPGTESKSAADVIMQSSQLPAEEIARKVGYRPIEKPEIQTFAVKGIQQKTVSPILGLNTIPKPIAYNRPVVDHTLVTHHNVLTNNQIHKNLAIPAISSIPSIPSLPSAVNLRQIESPIKVLSRFPQINTLKTFDLQQKEGLIQNYEQF